MNVSTESKRKEGPSSEPNTSPSAELDQAKMPAESNLGSLSSFRKVLMNVGAAVSTAVAFAGVPEQVSGQAPGKTPPAAPTQPMSQDVDDAPPPPPPLEKRVGSAPGADQIPEEDKLYKKSVSAWHVPGLYDDNGRRLEKLDLRSRQLGHGNALQAIILLRDQIMESHGGKLPRGHELRLVFISGGKEQTFPLPQNIPDKVTPESLREFKGDKKSWMALRALTMNTPVLYSKEQDGSWRIECTNWSINEADKGNPDLSNEKLRVYDRFGLYLKDRR